jgi:hypothetical protein
LLEKLDYLLELFDGRCLIIEVSALDDSLILVDGGLSKRFCSLNLSKTLLFENETYFELSGIIVVDAFYFAG